MASCKPFNVTFSGSATDLFEKVKKMIEDHGGTISGDATAGSFSVPVLHSIVAGTYTVSGQTATITITKRPWILPCKVIESWIKSHIPTIEKADMSEF